MKKFAVKKKLSNAKDFVCEALSKNMAGDVFIGSTVVCGMMGLNLSLLNITGWGFAPVLAGAGFGAVVSAGGLVVSKVINDKKNKVDKIM